jgi:hypothetical protein
MPIPSVKSEQTEQEYVSECISAIFDEYGQEQASAICYNTYRKEKNMSSQGRVTSKLRQENYRGINITNLEEGGLEDACWDGWKALGTKILDGRTVPNCIREEEHPDFKD